MSTEENALWDFERLRQHWGFRSIKHTKRVARQRGIVMDIGHKTKRVRPVDVYRSDAEAAGRGSQLLGVL